jgi:phosphohistidine swiveling domain-containing protein
MQLSKARTLARLEPLVKMGRIAPNVCFTVNEWSSGNIQLIPLLEKIGKGPYIVRSSSLSEDQSGTSNAGRFDSFLNVASASVHEAVQKVISSFGDGDPEDEILIQPMIKDVIRSGVAFSHDPNTNSPYRTVSWNDGPDTSIVTSGAGGRTWRHAALSPFDPPLFVQQVIQLLDEVQALLNGEPVDIEFAFSSSLETEVLWLLQARPLVLTQPPESVEEQQERLELIGKRIETAMRPHPFLQGSKTVFGVMPDWNPAEIVGVRPRPLALSLYRDMVTDSIWAYQRHNYGYRNLRGFPLMPHFFGLPYIDVRLSFNSFIPADLEDGLAGRLVDHYISELVNKPTLHDKVEFEIVHSCYSLDLFEKLKGLRSSGFSEDDVTQLADSLRRLTKRVINPETGLWRADAARLDVMDERRKSILGADLDPLDRIYWLLEDGKRYGTLPFAGLARAGFIAVQLLRSLVTVGLFSERDYQAFLGSVNTVSSQLAKDRTTMDRSAFLTRYGHLRPGTYDLRSARYDEAPELYFDWEKDVSPRLKPPEFSLTLKQLRLLETLIEQHSLEVDPIHFLTFIQSGIELRELGKFQFSKNLSDAIALISHYAQGLGFSTDEISYADITVFRELNVGTIDPHQALARSIEEGRARYAQTMRTSMPPLITSASDVWSFESPQSLPNFITQKSVIGRVAKPESRDQLEGAIVCIPSADPGFDWLFSFPIAGLITAWGGANSHMAIRAGENGIPAVIGVGEVSFGLWSTAGMLRIDCASRIVEILS